MIVGAIDLAHAALAQLGHDFIRPKGLANHCRGLELGFGEPRRSSRLKSRASGGGPPEPSPLTISHGPRRLRMARGIRCRSALSCYNPTMEALAYVTRPILK